MASPQKIAAAALAGVIVFSGLAITPQAAVAAEDPQISSFTLAILPDTQFYSRYATTEEGKQFQTRYGTEPFSSQTQWLVDNDENLGIPFVGHLGDIVDQVAKPDQWSVASNAMKILENGKLPYSIAPGNHDVSADWQTDDQRNPAAEPYLGTFNSARAASANPTTFQGRDPLGYSEYHIFEKDGQKYLQMALTWGAGDNTFKWAQGVLDANKTLPTIITSHQMINISDSGTQPVETDFGLKIWNNLIAKNNQVFMTVGGHHHGNANWVKKNTFGNPVLQVVNDYQMAYQGGNGYLGLYEFDFTNGQVRASEVSPWVVTKSKVVVNQFDQAVLRKPNERYNVPYDLVGRFNTITGGFTPGPADHTSYTEKAVDILYANYTEPVVPAREIATNEDDYYHAENTVAHWTFDGEDGEVVPVGGTVEDTAGTNTLKRAKLINGAQVEDVKYSSSAHALAANQGSVCFTGADRNTKRLSYFSTAAGTPLTKERFPNGYTIETFIKIDPSWTSEKNRWNSVMSSGGTRVAGSADSEAPPFFMGISSLLEVQWSVDPTNAVAKTNWSGEILKDTWLHVAAVNDVGTQTTTLYIEGAPVLRNSNGGVSGIETIMNAAWKLGASADYGTPDGGFLGCIGETRIVSEPLSADQWLTSRAKAPSHQTNVVAAADTFSRHNSSLGEEWNDARGSWAIKNKTAVVADSAGVNVAAYNKTELGDKFTVKSTLRVPTQNGNSQWVGTAFNVSGSTPASLSYYQLRYAPTWATNSATPTTTTNRWQLVKVTDGSTLTVVREGTFTANPTQPIDMTIERNLDVLSFSMEDYLGQQVVSMDMTLADFPSKVGGFAGLASNDADIAATAFAVTSSADAVVASAPQLTTASVTGQSVTAEWTASEVDGGSAITGYVATISKAVLNGSAIEVGDIVESTNAAPDARTATSSTLAAGTYVVSVRAVNAVGTSLASENSQVLTVTDVAVSPTPEPTTPSAPEQTPQAPTPVDSTVTVSAAASAYGRPSVVSVSVDAAVGGPVATGSITVYLDGKPLDEVPLVAGNATYKLPAQLGVGRHKVTAEYVGDSTTRASEKSTSVTISKATTVTKLKLSKTRVTRKSATKATVTVSVPGTSVVATGKVQLIVKGKVVKTVTLSSSSKGKATVTLPKFTKAGLVTVTAKYVGSGSLVSDASTRVKVRVKK